MKIKTNNTNIFFCSDLHLGHKNILQYDKRPFSSIEEHDEHIINNWNKTVKGNDLIFFLGDFAFKNQDYFYSRLNGKKTMLIGNHDKNRVKDIEYHDYVELKVEDQLICLFHYPIGEWNKCHQDSWLLYGHTHGNSYFDTDVGKKYKALNVGINVINYIPISYEEVGEKMENRLTLAHH